MNFDSLREQKEKLQIGQDLSSLNRPHYMANKTKKKIVIGAGGGPGAQKKQIDEKKEMIRLKKELNDKKKLEK